MAADDDELMNDLMTQLDSRDQTVQSESVNVLNEININKQIDVAESSGHKQDPKSRFLARQVSDRHGVFLRKLPATDVPRFRPEKRRHWRSISLQ